jgi:16S rRNA processing protein RimM
MPDRRTQGAETRQPKGNGALVCLGEIVGAHGVRGALKVRSFAAEPTDIAAYGTLCDASGERQFALNLEGAAGGALIVRVAGVETRDAAEALAGISLYVPRTALPEPEPESFYHVDLIGLEARDAAGLTLGRVRAVLALPAGDVIEIEQSDGGELLVPFSREAVPTIDLAAGMIVVEPLREVLAR